MGTIADKLTYLNETKTKIKDNLNFGGANITNETFREYANKIKDLYVYFMNNGLEVVWNNWEKVIGSGTTITLNQTMEAPIKIDLKGNTEQDGTPTPTAPIEVETTTGGQVVRVCGKNILKLIRDNETGGSYDSATDTYSSSTRTGTAVWYFKTETTSLSYTFSTQSVSNIEYLYCFSNNDLSTGSDIVSLTYNSGGNITNGNTTIYNNSNLKYLYVTFRTSTTNVNATLEKPMLEVGETPSTYEEYKGTDYEINLGKNLYNADDTTYYGSCTYVSGANTNQYKIKATGTDIIINSQVASGSSYSSGAGTLIPCKYGETIYYDTGNSNFSKNYITQYNSSKVSLGFASVNSSSGSYTPTNSACEYISIRIGYGSATSGTEYTLAPIISKSSNLTYSPYKTPIELCKIGNYQDFIRKSTGKNLFDIDNATIKQDYGKNADGNEVSSPGGNYTTSYTQVKPNTTYTFSSILSSVVARIYYYDENKNWITRSDNIKNDTNKFTFTTPNNCYYLQFQNVVNFTDKAQLELGNQATTYEPYGTGQWYIHKEIGRVVVNGTESGWILRTSTSQNYIKFRNDNIFPSDMKDRLSLISNYFVANTGANDASYSGNAICGNLGQYAKWLHVSIDNTIVSDVATFTTWLGTHNLEIYYILATPTSTLIEDYELIYQLNELEKAKSYDNTTNILQSNDNLPFILDVRALKKI